MSNTTPSSARSAFPEPLRRQVDYTDIESLFGEGLHRHRSAVGALWSHQVDQLRTYESDHMETSDVALELPTGSGKTLVGLLIAEWRRRTLKARVVYACPTRQLALQVAASAERQGVQARTLIDSHHNWDSRDLLAYNRADALAITTYSHIFNINSQFGSANTIIFDDAHAAENYVAGAWAVEVPATTPAFSDLFDAFGEAIDPLLAARMTEDGQDAASWNEVRLLPITAVVQRVKELDSVLSTGLEAKSNAWWHFKMVRENLASCLFYVSRRGWYIRPMIPPTFQHEALTAPAQRVYLSATLGEAGELERAFGRFPIARIPAPAAWERTGGGRRFFVFPELAQFEKATDLDQRFSDDEQPDLIRRLGELTPKRVVLTQDAASAARVAEALGGEGDVVTASDLTVAEFRDASTGTLLAANRYDGMDLAADSCRLEVMSGVPAASHLQDEFLSSKLRAREVLAERVRTRVVQGMGRCTRGPQDWSVVVIHGHQLVNYLSTPENIQSMPVDLQAEIEFGMRASAASFKNVLTVTQSALAQDADWRTIGEERIAEHRAEAVRTPQTLAHPLSDSAPLEVNAWRAAWAGRWTEAAQQAVAVMEQFTHPDARAYRSLWAYFASAWFRLDGTTAGAERGADLLRNAHKSAAGTVWLREIEALPADEVEHEPADVAAVRKVVDRISNEFASATKFSQRGQTMLAGLAKAEASPYELALVELGIFLGADSHKPDGKGRADAVWVWDELWITIEAKSEQTASMLSMDYVRQANTQLSSLGTDRDEAIPASSISVVAAQQPLVDPDAVAIANPNVTLVTVDVLMGIARDAHRALGAVRASVAGVSRPAAESIASKLLWDARVMPTQVKDRLSRTPIRGA